MPASQIPPSGVSALAYSDPQARRWLTLQVACQLLSGALVIAMFILAGQGKLAQAGSAPTAVLLFALALGFGATIAIVVQARLTVQWQSEDTLRGLLLAIAQSGYVEQGAVGNAVLYRRDLPAALRRDQQLVRITRDGDLLVVTGPAAKLRKMRKLLIA
jgi:hypothetical protein